MADNLVYEESLNTEIDTSEFISKNDGIEIANDVTNKSNKDLVNSRDFLIEEYTKTKEIIIDLTKHLDGVEELYNKVNNELEKRIK